MAGYANWIDFTFFLFCFNRISVLLVCASHGNAVFNEKT